MPNALETPWVTLEVNDVPLSLCNDLSRQNLRMISWNSFFTTSSAFSVQVGKPSTHSAAAAAAAKSLPLLPHRQQPTRLLHPWDSPGKNVGVGCHFLLQCMKVKSLSCVRLFATPWTVAYQAPPSMGVSRQEYWSGLPLLFPSIHPVNVSIMTNRYLYP